MALQTLYGRRVEGRLIPVSSSAKTQSGNIYEVRIHYAAPVADWIVDKLVKTIAPEIIKIYDKLNKKIEVIWIGIDTSKNMIYVQFRDIGALFLKAIGTLIVQIIKQVVPWLAVLGVSYFAVKAVQVLPPIVPEDKDKKRKRKRKKEEGEEEEEEDKDKKFTTEEILALGLLLGAIAARGGEK